MGTDDLETEFFGSSRRSPAPRRSDRARAKRDRREERRRLRPLGSRDPEERSRAAVGLVEGGLDGAAATLLEFVANEPEAQVRAAVAHAVLAAPVSADPDGREAKLRDWAVAELMRHGGSTAVAAAVPPVPAPYFSGPAPVAPGSPPLSLSSPALASAAAPSPARAPVPHGTLSPDDRWRSGLASTTRRRSAPAAPPPPPAPPRPPVVGGTIGVPPVRDPAPTAPGGPGQASAQPEPDPAPEPEPETEPEISPEPEPVLAATPAPTEPTPAPAKSTNGSAATWRIVKASPVDIVVWEPAEPSA